MTPTFPAPNSLVEEADAAVAFTFKLGLALHRYGTPAHRLEDAMAGVARRLGMEGQFFATPTTIFAAFGGSDRPQQTFLMRADPGDVDLGKLSDLDALIEQVAHGTLSVPAASAAVDAVMASPGRYNRVTQLVTFAVVSGSAARFFGGGWREMAVAAGLGLLMGFLAWLVGRRRELARLFEPLASLVLSLAAIAAAVFIGNVSVYVTLLAGLIVLVPGLRLTVAMTEIATQNLLAGTARLTSAFTTFLLIGFGVALGNKLGTAWWGATPSFEPVLPPAWSTWAALVVAPMGIGMLFGARRRDLGWIIFAGMTAFGSARWGAIFFGPELGAFVGALLVGMVANIYARLLNRPSAVPLVPGLVMLVPGTIGFAGISSLLARDMLSGLELTYTMLAVAAALVTGLLMANVVVPPRKAL